jgi:hypothetical protein
MRLEWEKHHTIDRSMLHYSDDGSQIASRRCPSGACRKGQVGDNKGSRTRARHSMLRVQLLQSNEFQSIGDIFLRPRQDAIVNLSRPEIRQEEFKSASGGTPQTRLGTLYSWEILFHSSPLVAFSLRWTLATPAKRSCRRT